MLCDLYLPRPIRSKADAQAAAQGVEALVGHALSEGEEVYLEIISNFLDEYDREHSPQLPEADPVDVLRMLMDAEPNRRSPLFTQTNSYSATSWSRSDRNRSPSPGSWRWPRSE